MLTAAPLAVFRIPVDREYRCNHVIIIFRQDFHRPCQAPTLLHLEQQPNGSLYTVVRLVSCAGKTSTRPALRLRWPTPNDLFGTTFVIMLHKPQLAPNGGSARASSSLSLIRLMIRPGALASLAVRWCG